MQNPQSLSVLVVGGGIGGLTAALCLARKNFSVTLLEKRDVFKEVGAGIQISPNGSRVLIELGLGDILDKHAVRPAGINVYDGVKGARLAQIPLIPYMEEKYHAPYYTVARSDLHSALADAAMAHDNIDIHFESYVTAVATDGDRVAVTANENEEMFANIMVGADGVWSATRQLVLDDGAAKYTGHTAWRALIDIKKAPESMREMAVNLWLGPKTHLVHYPVCAGTKVNIVAITESNWEKEGWNHRGNPKQLRALFSEWDAAPRELLHAMGRPLKWALCGRQPDYDWHGVDRVTLLGDAAHPMLPYLAQGAVMAIEDGYVLAEELSSHEDPVVALRSYEKIRAPRTGKVQQGAFDNAAHYHLSGIAGQARNLALRAAGLAPGVFLKRYDWLYSKNVIGR